MRQMLPRSRRHPRGLTLVELMVTIVVAFIVLASVYMLYENGARTARLQTQMTQAETQLRIAMDHLWRDVMRTGFRATANSVDDQLRNRICWVPPGTEFLGMTMRTDHGDVHDPTVNINVEPTSVTLFGDLFTPLGRAFKTLSIDSATAQVALRSDDLLSAMSKSQFEALFRPGAHWVQVVNGDGQSWYSPITAVTYETLTLTLGGTPTSAGYCSQGRDEGLDINPVGWVRYRIVEDDYGADLLDPGGADRMVGKTDLVREELDATGAPVDGTQLTVAEYVVDLQFYDFVFDDTAPGAPNKTYTVQNFASDVTDDGSAGGELALNDPTARPEDLRFVTAKLSVRTPDEDADFLFEPRTDVYGPLDRYDVYTDVEGSARVISLAKRMELRNFWLRRQR